jgi:hypothetical protein
MYDSYPIGAIVIVNFDHVLRLELSPLGTRLNEPAFKLQRNCMYVSYSE